MAILATGKETDYTIFWLRNKNFGKKSLNQKFFTFFWTKTDQHYRAEKEEKIDKETDDVKVYDV